jgi:hypothetical protein
VLRFIDILFFFRLLVAVCSLEDHNFVVDDLFGAIKIVVEAQILHDIVKGSRKSQSDRDI